MHGIEDQQVGVGAGGRRRRDGMRSALGPCSNDDRVSLCQCVWPRRSGRESQAGNKGTAGTHVLHVPSWLLCLLLPLAVAPATHPPPLGLLLAPAAVIAPPLPRLSSTAWAICGTAGTGTLSVCRHPPTCSLALPALDYRSPILHLDTVLLFLFPCLFNRSVHLPNVWAC